MFRNLLVMTIMLMLIPVAFGADRGIWGPDVCYAVGDLVTDQLFDYRCIQAHKSQAGWESVPLNRPTLWGIHKVPDPVLFWNAITLQADANDHTGKYAALDQGGPTRSSRAFAIVHAAIFDAVNSINRSFKPYLTLVPGAEDADVNSAVATAAHLTLVALYPSQQAFFDAVRRNFFALFPLCPGIREGIRVGKIVANAILRARSNDGSDAPMQYTPKLLPGFHREDPRNPGQGFLTPQWGQVRPFVVLSSTQFMVPPPPPLTSDAYTAAWNDVKLFGGDGIITPTIRTLEQTLIGLFWSYDGNPGVGTPPRLYNQIARVIALQRRNNTVQNARLFGLINLALADAGITTWETKYFYEFWRPILGIREASPGTGPTGLGDGNPDTIADPFWTPLGAPATNMPGDISFTPNFPSYTSGHAAFGASMFRMLALFFGTDNIAFTFVSDELNGRTIDMTGAVRPLVPRSFSTLTQATLENARSRIYLGIHWQFDADFGIVAGRAIADYVFNNALLPILTPTPTPTPIPTPTTSGTCTAGTLPLNIDGAITKCITLTTINSYVNSWECASVKINGQDFTNRWASAAELPAKVNGLYTIEFRGRFDWSHLEAK